MACLSDLNLGNFVNFLQRLRQQYEDASLQRKIALVMGVGGILVTAVMASAAFLVSHHLIIANTQATQVMTAKLVEREIVLRIESAIALAKSLAGNTVTANALADNVGRATYLGPLMSAQTLPFPEAIIFLTDYQGRVVASNRILRPDEGVAEKALVAETLQFGRPVVAVVKQQGGGRALVAAFPVLYRLTGQTEGAVVLSIPTSVIPPGNSSRHQIALRDAGESLIAGSIGGSNAIQTEVPLVLPEPMHELRLRVVVSQDRRVALRDLDVLIVVFLVVCALLLMAVTVVSRAAARLLSHPMSELANAAARISDTGRPGPVMEVNRKDEFGQLARAFQAMLKRLSESYAVLELRVEERTHALKASEQKLASILSSLDDTVWSLSPDGQRVTYMSPSAYGLTGLPLEQLKHDLGLFFAEVFPEDLESVHAALNQMIHQGATIDIEFRFKNPKKGLRILQARAHPVFDDHGKVIRLDCILSDVTQRSEAEALLRSRELYLRAILDNFPFMVWLKDIDSRFLAVNKRFAEASGERLPDEFRGLDDFAVWPEPMARQYQADDREVIASGCEKNVEEALLVNGQRRWIETFKKPVVTLEGEVIGTVGFARDISGRKEMERHLAESEERWELAISGSNDGIWDWNVESGYVFFSDRWKTMLGYAPDEIQNRFDEWAERIHPDDRDRVTAEVTKHLAGESDLYLVEHRVRCRDGEYRWILARGRAVRDASGKPTRFLGSHSDIHEKVIAEAGLRHRTAQLNSIFALSPDGFVAFGDNDWVEYVSPAFVALTGLSDHDVIGLTEHVLLNRLAALCIPDSRSNQIALEELRAFGANGSQNPLGKGRYLLEFASPEPRTIEVGRRSSEAQSVSRIFYFRDVTHEAEVDRLKSEFLSTAAHELRTPMVSILGFSELLMTNKDFDSDTVNELVQTIHRQSSLMASIVNELLDLARIEARRGQDFEIESLDLNALIRDAVQSFKFPDDQRVPELALCDSPARMQGDRRKITQALLNVVSNAFKYSPDGGSICITLQPDVRAGRNGFCIEVCDQGIGMTPASAAMICDRFFRADTSGAILGTGLGMSIVKEIVDLHGGSLNVSSALGEGTRVCLWFAELAPGTEKNIEEESA